MSRWMKVMAAVLFASFFAGSAEAAEVGYKGGFYIKDDEGAFKLKINGRIQPRIRFSDDNLSRGVLTFRIRRSNINFKATVHKKTNISFGLYHSTNSRNFDSVNIGGLRVSHEIIPQLTISMGMVGLPLDMGFSSSASLITESPIVWTESDQANAFTLSRGTFGAPDGLGINLSGDIGKFFYSWSVVNGSESNYALNPDFKFSTGLQLGYHIFDAVGGSLTDYGNSSKPKLSVSMGVNYQGRRTDNSFAEAQQEAFDAANINTNSVAPEIRRIMTFSGGSGFRYAGFSAQVEAYYRLTKFSSFGTLPNELTTNNGNVADLGYYAALGYYIVPKKFEVALQAGQMFRQGPDNNANQFGGGLNYYFKGHNFKTQLSYQWTEDYSAITGNRNKNKHVAALQLQAKF